MANHVNNFITVEFPPSQEGVVNSILDTVVKNDNIHCLYENPVMSRDWYEKNIGAKWARFNDDPYIEDNVLSLNIESAWHEISPFIDRLNEMTNCECTIRHEFVDEMPNFVGNRVYENGRVYKELIIEDMEEMIEEEAEIREKAEGLSFEDSSEREDWIWDWKWDFVYGKMEMDE